MMSTKHLNPLDFPELYRKTTWTGLETELDLPPLLYSNILQSALDDLSEPSTTILHSDFPPNGAQRLPEMVRAARSFVVDSLALAAETFGLVLNAADHKTVMYEIEDEVHGEIVIIEKYGEIIT